MTRRRKRIVLAGGALVLFTWLFVDAGIHGNPWIAGATTFLFGRGLQPGDLWGEYELYQGTIALRQRQPRLDYRLSLHADGSYEQRITYGHSRWTHTGRWELGQESEPGFPVLHLYDPVVEPAPEGLFHRPPIFPAQPRISASFDEALGVHTFFGAITISYDEDADIYFQKKA